MDRARRRALGWLVTIASTRVRRSGTRAPGRCDRPAALIRSSSTGISDCAHFRRLAYEIPLLPSVPDGAHRQSRPDYGCERDCFHGLGRQPDCIGVDGGRDQRKYTVEQVLGRGGFAAMLSNRACNCPLLLNELGPSPYGRLADARQSPIAGADTDRIERGDPSRGLRLDSARRVNVDCRRLAGDDEIDVGTFHAARLVGSCGRTRRRQLWPRVDGFGVVFEWLANATRRSLP